MVASTNVVKVEPCSLERQDSRDTFSNNFLIIPPDETYWPFTRLVHCQLPQLSTRGWISGRQSNTMWEMLHTFNALIRLFEISILTLNPSMSWVWNAPKLCLVHWSVRKGMSGISDKLNQNYLCQDDYILTQFHAWWQRCPCLLGKLRSTIKEMPPQERLHFH